MGVDSALERYYKYLPLRLGPSSSTVSTALALSPSAVGSSFGNRASKSANAIHSICNKKPVSGKRPRHRNPAVKLLIPVSVATAEGITGPTGAADQETGPAMTATHSISGVSRGVDVAEALSDDKDDGEDPIGSFNCHG
jgi:hypothetical protein